MSETFKNCALDYQVTLLHILKLYMTRYVTFVTRLDQSPTTTTYAAESHALTRNQHNWEEDRRG